MSGGLRILHTESSLGWGGQEMRILSEAAGLEARGHQLALAAPPQARIFAAARDQGLEVFALPIARKNLRGLLAMRALLRLRSFDLVNTHSSTDSWLAALARRTLPGAPPIVRTRHISAPVPDNPASRWLYRSACVHVVTTGQTLREQLMRSQKLSPTQVSSVPTGMDISRFRPGDRAAARRALGLPPQMTLVGIVATLRSWKGHRYLIEAMAALHRADLGLIIVGDGPQREALQEQAGAAGLAHFSMPGQQADVLPWLQALDIFALPSYANEGVPQALVQAMLCALPCVTTGVGAIGEAALADRTALVVPPRDAAALARATARLADDAALRGHLGAAAREHCAARFDIQVMLDRMEAIFRAASGR